MVNANKKQVSLIDLRGSPEIQRQKVFKDLKFFEILSNILYYPSYYNPEKF